MIDKKFDNFSILSYDSEIDEKIEPELGMDKYKVMYSLGIVTGITETKVSIQLYTRQVFQLTHTEYIVWSVCHNKIISDTDMVSDVFRLLLSYQKDPYIEIKNIVHKLIINNLIVCRTGPTLSFAKYNLLTALTFKAYNISLLSKYSLFLKYVLANGIKFSILKSAIKRMNFKKYLTPYEFLIYSIFEKEKISDFNTASYLCNEKFNSYGTSNYIDSAVEAVEHLMTENFICSYIKIIDELKK